MRALVGFHDVVVAQGMNDFQARRPEGVLLIHGNHMINVPYITPDT